MHWHFALPGTPTVPCRIEKSFWLGRLQLFGQGKTVPRSRDQGRPFLVPRPGGEVVRVFVRGNGWDYLPQVEVDGQTVHLGRPLSSVEYLVGGLPLVLLFVGGAIGGASGAIGTLYSYRILRTTLSVPVKLAGILGITGASLLIYLILASLLGTLIGH